MTYKHFFARLLVLLITGSLLAACAQSTAPAASAPTSNSVNLPLVAASDSTALPQPTAAPSPEPTAAPSPEPVATALVAVEPSPSPEPSPVPTALVAVERYTGYTAVEGDTLASIASQGGSTPDLIREYNLLDGEPAPDRALIVPQVAGQTSTLEDESILVERGRNDKPWVALTLDAGASAVPVPQMLQTLRDHHVTITFFLTGQWITENPEIARQIVADGHEIANHSFTHPDFRKISDAEIVEELDSTDRLMRETTGASTRPFFRPPFGAYDKRTLLSVEAQGYLPIYWTLDSLDSVGEPKSPAFLTERITAKLPPEKLRGAIILAHCGSQPTADALPGILDRFAAMGFEVKKLSEVLGG